MTAIIYFGEMVVALMLAIFFLATSTFSMGEAVALFSGGVVALTLALQLPFMQVSESMGNHDSKIVDAASVD